MVSVKGTGFDPTVPSAVAIPTGAIEAMRFYRLVPGKGFAFKVSDSFLSPFRLFSEQLHVFDSVHFFLLFIVHFGYTCAFLIPTIHPGGLHG
jgi:hypothetical protein